jgi:hypothetical protein
MLRGIEDELRARDKYAETLRPRPAVGFLIRKKTPGSWAIHRTASSATTA